MPKLEMIKDGHLGGYIHGGDPGTWCPHLWSWLVREQQICSVLDVGCGEGHSTRFFQSLGCTVTGVEGCQQALDNSVLPGRIVKHDFCRGAFVPDQPCDLIWSCEFLEHVEERYVENILRTFAQARKLILVTHAFPGQDDGHHHVNCQPSSYWIQKIERLGFLCDVALSRQARTVTLRDYHSVNHFARSGLVFRRPDHCPIAVGVCPEPVARGPVAAVVADLYASTRSFAINQGFWWSAACRAHLRQRRAAKRAARQASAA